MIDLFRRPFNFLLPDHQSQYRTFLGSMLSIITILLILVYGGYKIVLYFKREEFTVNQTRQSYYFGLEDEFSQSHGLAIAAGAVSEGYDGIRDFSIDPEIGQLKFYLKTWDITGPDLTKHYIDFKPIKSTFCNFNAEKGDLKGFYPRHQSQDFTVDNLEQMICIDEHISISGLINMGKGQNLMVAFEKCDKRTSKCKSDSEIEDWLEFRYMIVLENNKAFS